MIGNVRDQIEALPRFTGIGNYGPIVINPDGLFVLRAEVLRCFPGRPLQRVDLVMCSKFTPETGQPEIPGVLLKATPGPDGWWVVGDLEGDTHNIPQRYIRHATPAEIGRYFGPQA